MVLFRRGKPDETAKALRDIICHCPGNHPRQRRDAVDARASVLCSCNRRGRVCPRRVLGSFITSCGLWIPGCCLDTMSKHSESRALPSFPHLGFRKQTNSEFQGPLATRIAMASLTFLFSVSPEKKSSKQEEEDNELSSSDAPNLEIADLIEQLAEKRFGNVRCVAFCASCVLCLPLV